MALAIVMPAYNESECIEHVVKSWLDVLERAPGCIIVVNDGSRDKTGEILDTMARNEPRLKVIHQANAGHGAAVLRGYREALKSGERYIFQTDSDDQFIPADFFKLWELRDDSPFLMGNRVKRSDAFVRKIVTRIVRLLNFLFFGVWLRDSNIPFRLMRSEFLSELLPLIPPDVFAPNIFLTVLAAKAGAALHEVPITHLDRATGTVSIRKWKLFKVCVRSARELLRFRLSLIGRRSQFKGLRARYAVN